MADIRDIVLIGDPILREKAVPVQRFNDKLHKLLDDMKVTMVAKDGVGLAAPQVGISKQILVFDRGDDQICEMINPELIEYSGEVEDSEGCLSVPGRYGKVKRYQQVVVKCQTRDGDFIKVTACDHTARVIQHEMDHLQGRLFVDIATEVKSD